MMRILTILPKKLFSVVHCFPLAQHICRVSQPSIINRRYDYFPRGFPPTFCGEGIRLRWTQVDMLPVRKRHIPLPSPSSLCN